jgi:hypothetical protein
MTVNITTPSSRSRTTPIAAHTYRVPVVRELPVRAVEIRDASTW